MSRGRGAPPTLYIREIRLLGTKELPKSDVEETQGNRIKISLKEPRKARQEGRYLTGLNHEVVPMKRTPSLKSVSLWATLRAAGR